MTTYAVTLKTNEGRVSTRHVNAVSAQQAAQYALDRLVVDIVAVTQDQDAADYGKRYGFRPEAKLEAAL